MEHYTLMPNNEQTQFQLEIRICRLRVKLQTNRNDYQYHLTNIVVVIIGQLLSIKVLLKPRMYLTYSSGFIN